MSTEIDILSDGYLYAFKITFISETGKTRSYISPFVFEDYSEAYDNALYELAN